MLPHAEKIIEHVKIHLPESTKIALLEEAAKQDRPASELGRIAIELYLFGHVGRRDRKKRGAGWDGKDRRCPHE